MVRKFHTFTMGPHPLLNCAVLLDERTQMRLQLVCVQLVFFKMLPLGEKSLLISSVFCCLPFAGLGLLCVECWNANMG